MPLGRRAEAAPQGPDADPRADQALLRPQMLTLELLDWLIAALENVLRTQQVQDLPVGRTVPALRDALKAADRLYPLTLEALRAK